MNAALFDNTFPSRSISQLASCRAANSAVTSLAFALYSPAPCNVRVPEVVVFLGTKDVQARVYLWQSQKTRVPNASKQRKASKAPKETDHVQEPIALQIYAGLCEWAEIPASTK